MSKRNIEEQVVFMLGSSPDGPVLMFGMTEGAWDYMKDGMTHTFDFTKIGVPLKAIVYRAATHNDAMKEIEKFASANNIPFLDERRKDFSI